MNEHFINRFVDRSTLKLATTYLSIIMSMSIVFSFVLYGISIRHLERPFLIRQGSVLPLGNDTSSPLPDDTVSDNQKQKNADLATREELRSRFDEARGELMERLLLLNSITFCFGVIVSLVLARLSLTSFRQILKRQVQFVNDVSHELRTPLAVLQTSNEVALRKKHLTAEESKLLLERNVRQIRRLRDMANSLLYLLNMRNEPIMSEPVSLSTCITEVKKDFEHLAAERLVTIETSLDSNELVVKANVQFTVRILSILLENAIKYSPKNSKIVIRGYKDDTHVYVSVRDEGKGIDSKDIPHLFTRFYSTATKKENAQERSYGIGLSIAKRLAKEMGSDIVTYTVSKGAEFRLEFKYQEPK